MESNSLSNLIAHLGINTNDFEAIKNILEEEMLYEIKYNVMVNDVKMSTDLIEYWITVPEKSELLSQYGFKMEGIYLAKQFKEFIIGNIEKLNKEVGMSKIRVRVHYTLEPGKLWTLEESEIALDEYKPTIIDEAIKHMEANMKEVN